MDTPYERKIPENSGLWIVSRLNQGPRRQESSPTYPYSRSRWDHTPGLFRMRPGENPTIGISAAGSDDPAADMPDRYTRNSLACKEKMHPAGLTQSEIEDPIPSGLGISGVRCLGLHDYHARAHLPMASQPSEFIQP